jgi:multidrug efflux pump subunit AcrA (membrane-fusion protein)
MKTKRINKILPFIIIIIVIVISLLNLSACRTLGENLLDTQTFEVARGDIVQIVSASGYVDSTSTHNYSLSTAGKVKYTLDKGDKFASGDLLFEIDSERQALLVSQAQENVNISEDSLELAQIGYQQALDANHIAVQLSEINKELAEQTTQSAYTAMVGTEDIANNLIANARTARDEAERILEEAKNDPLVTDTQLAQFEANLANSEANYNAVKAQQNSSKSSAQSGFEQSQLSQSSSYWTSLGNTQTARSQIDIARKNIDQTEKQLALSQISLELAKMDMDSYTIYAPYDGIVLSSSYSPGEYASPGVPAISIIEKDLVVKAEVNETDVVSLKEGQEAEVRLDAYYDYKFEGRIIQISPISSNIGGVVSFEVMVELDTQDSPEVLYGFSASLDIITSSVDDVLYVPIQYVYEEDSISYVDVLTQEGDKVKTEVTTGISNYDLVEIKSGLSEGDIVTTSSI